METKVIKTELNEAAELIQRGELVAIPTETVYGLACNGLNENAVNDIYEVKGRPAVKPLSLMVPGIDAIDLYCDDIPVQAKLLAKKFWPGPLTIVLKAKDNIPEIVRAGGSTVGLRCPDHPLTLKILELSKLPFAAPSANPSGEDSPKDAEKVLEYFNGKISAVVDGGPCGIGTESTLIDMSASPYKILRQGALSEDAIADALLENMTVLGLTGPSGGGKTSALKHIESLGGLVIDCDALYHGILERSSEMIAELDEAFPGMVVNGELDRKKLGVLVFTDYDALDKLNDITHKYILLEVKQSLRNWAMNGGKLAAIDAVELISSGLDDMCSACIAVLADEEIRIHRIMERDSIDRTHAEMRSDAQKEDDYYRENCHFVVENNGSKDEFIHKISLIIQEVTNNGRS